ncbi:hypothetical protein TSUD_06170, partial [Trifolium subterraneum]
SNGRGRGRSTGGRGHKFNKENIECYKCHKLGHFQSECPNWEEDNANYAQFDEEEEILLMAQETKGMTDEHSQTWFLDSGCSNHMIGNKEWLFDYDDTFKDSVKLGDDSKMAVMGQLQQKSITVIFKNDTCKVFHDDKGLIMTTHMSMNRMYIIKAPIIIPTCLKVSQNSEAQLWHQRYDHLSFKGMKILAQKNMVHGLPDVKEPNQSCTHCMKGKQQRDYVPKKSSWRASTKLELIHSDICGPINPESNGKKRGGEYTSTTFNEFCDTHGIKRQLTTAYTPQQNGVSERKNKTIMNTVRCMLGDKNVPKTFWPEAVKWAIHIINRSPTFAVKDMTPEEAWSSSKPVVRLSDESKAYKMYDPVNKKIIISEDVKFDENKQWNWDTKEIERHKSVIVDTYSETCSTSKLSDYENVAENDSVADDNDVNEAGADNTPQDEVVPDSEDDEVNEGTLGKRISRKPGYLEDFVTDDEALHNLAIFSPSDDPTTYDETAKLDIWRNAMNTEIAAIESNDTWELTELPKGAKKIGVKWIYKTKYNEQGKIEKYRARLVAKVYSQQHGIDYDEVFAPVARWDTIRTILAIAALRGWYVYQLDVKSAFLHGELNEEVYVEQPLGYQKERKELVYKLKKSLYGLKQAPRACLYVDDLIFTGNDQKLFDKFKLSMEKNFAMTDLGRMRYFLGVEVRQDNHGNNLKRDENGKANNATNYKQMVGCLMYLLATRPDLAFYVCLVARYMERPTKIHVAAVKRILRYLKGTLSHGIWYERGKGDDLMGWSDYDYAEDIDDRRSTSGFVFMIGSKVVSWSSKKQPIVTLSTTEAEFIAAASSVCQGIWL